MGRDIDLYGKPWLWKITLDDYDEDPRQETDGGHVCPSYDPEIVAHCGHPWSHCKTHCPLNPTATDPWKDEEE